MKILLIGSGGREHALAWKITENPKVSKLFIAPGNGGTSEFGENVAIQAGDIQSLVNFAKKNSIDLVVPGPELPLVLGIVDAMQKENISCFGPNYYAAQLEGSKAFAKKIMLESNVPTADFAVFTDPLTAKAYVKAGKLPLVIKADGLAAGKGVVVAKTEEEAIIAIEEMMEQKIFGKSGETIIIEEALFGEEASFMAFCCNEDVLPLPSAQDHKPVFDNDLGPNTGGMGAYSPAPILPQEKVNEIIDMVMKPVLKTLIKHGQPFKGILYAGLMMTKDGPKVLEFNTRFGDPECQPLLMRLNGDLTEIMLSCIDNSLGNKKLPLDPKTALCIVIAAKGYPGEYLKNIPLKGLKEAEETADTSKGEKVKVFHAGTKIENNQLLSIGGRILGVTALAESLAEAKKLAYMATDKLCLDNLHFRSDIGDKGLKRIKTL